MDGSTDQRSDAPVEPGPPAGPRDVARREIAGGCTIESPSGFTSQLAVVASELEARGNRGLGSVGIEDEPPRNNLPVGS
jgi:hypothetical protein